MPAILPLTFIPNFWEVFDRPLTPDPFPRPTHCMTVPNSRYKCSNMFARPDSMVERVPGAQRPDLVNEASELYRDLLRFTTCLGSYKREIQIQYDPLAQDDEKVVTASFEVNDATKENEE